VGSNVAPQAQHLSADPALYGVLYGVLYGYSTGTLRVLYGYSTGTLRVLYGVLYGYSTGSCGRSLLKQKAAVSVVDRVLSCDAKSRWIDCAYVMQTFDGLTSRTVPLSRRTQSERRVRL
jgi:hypothetical protein